MIDRDELSATMRFKQGRMAPEPRIVNPPKSDSAIVCDCGARFTFAQGFDAFDRHINGGECPTSQED